MSLSGSSAFASETVAPNGRGTDRDEKGLFRAGNGAALKTGLRADRAQLPEVFRALETEVTAFLEGSLADDGGLEEIPTRRLSQHQYRAALHRQILHLNATLETHGLFDRRHKLRVLWLSKLESLIRETRALDQSLGLARRSKPVADLDTYLTDRYAGRGAADEPAGDPHASGGS